MSLVLVGSILVLVGSILVLVGSILVLVGSILVLVGSIQRPAVSAVLPTLSVFFLDVPLGVRMEVSGTLGTHVVYVCKVSQFCHVVLLSDKRDLRILVSHLKDTFPTSCTRMSGAREVRSHLHFLLCVSRM